MDWEFMKQVNDHQIEKEINHEMDRQAKIKKRELEHTEREELIDGLIFATIVLLLVIAGGFVNAI